MDDHRVRIVAVDSAFVDSTTELQVKMLYLASDVTEVSPTASHLLQTAASLIQCAAVHLRGLGREPHGAKPALKQVSG